MRAQFSLPFTIAAASSIGASGWALHRRAIRRADILALAQRGMYSWTTTSTRVGAQHLAGGDGRQVDNGTTHTTRGLALAIPAAVGRTSTQKLPIAFASPPLRAGTPRTADVVDTLESGDDRVKLAVRPHRRPAPHPSAKETQ
jgi:hypothetical protein